MSSNKLSLPQAAKMRLAPWLLVAIAVMTFCTVVMAEADKPKTISAIDEFIAQQVKSLGGQESGPRQTSDAFDFDGLRNPDVAILYRVTKDNDTTAYLAVFEQSEDTWHLTHHLRLGGRGLRHITQFKTQHRGIEIQSLEFQDDEPLSSPSLKVTLTITMQHGLLDIKRTPQKI